MSAKPFTRTLSLALSLGAALSCQSSHPFTQPAPPPSVVLAAADPAAYPGLPAAWHGWVGIDALAEAPTINWSAHLDGEFAGVIANLNPAAQGCLYEITHRVGELERRWFLLITADDDEPLETRTAKMTTTEPATDSSAGQERGPIDVPILFKPTRVTVAPAGKSPGPDREVALPIVAPRLGYSVGLAVELTTEYRAREAAGHLTDEVFETYTVTTSKPLVVLLSLFIEIQGHKELSAILREVVDAPSMLGVLLAGGLDMNLACDISGSTAVQHDLIDGREVPGVTFPAKVTVSGDLALELEVFAVESVDPVALVGGLIGLRAQRPGRPDESVTLRLIGAGVDRD